MKHYGSILNYIAYIILLNSDKRNCAYTQQCSAINTKMYYLITNINGSSNTLLPNLEGVKAEYQNRQILKNPSVGMEQCRNRFRSSLPVRNRYNQPTAIGCSSLQLFITSLHGLLWLQSTITGSFLPALRSFCSWNILIWWCTQLSNLKIFCKLVAN